MIGSRLRLARVGAGLSLRKLSDKLDNQISAQAIGKYERNEMMPSSKILMALAEALGVSENYLLSQSNIQLEGLEFRKKKITRKKDEANVQATVLSRVERYLEIEDLIQSPTLEWDQPRSKADFVIRDMKDVELAAERLRSHWNLGTHEPIPCLAEFLEERGIKVFSLDLPKSVSGLTCWVRRKTGSHVPVIVINAEDSGERQRFTLAHELGHIILNVAPNLDEEKVSHRFSGAFLMPASILRMEIGQNRHQLTTEELLFLKPFFGVSVQAMTYRCKDLEIINARTFQNLFKEFSDKGWRSPPYEEPHKIPKENPCRFQRLCYRAIAEGAISIAKGAELLETTVMALTEKIGEESIEAISEIASLKTDLA